MIDGRILINVKVAIYFFSEERRKEERIATRKIDIREVPLYIGLFPVIT